MSLIVVVQETALRALGRIRVGGQEAFASIKRALAALAEQPHPDQAVAWGGSGIYRLHLPGIRILYEVNEDAETVYVINVAVTK
jgi:mRNA-degrading endonuclease RelE of RelBE toxin-antitoxin system